MPATDTILKAIRTTNMRPWGRFLSCLPDRPHIGEYGAFKDLRDSLNALEAMELVVLQLDNDTRVEELALTPLGVERLKEIEEQESIPRPMKSRTPAERRYR